MNLLKTLARKVLAKELDTLASKLWRFNHEDSTMKYDPSITLMAAAELKSLEDLPPGSWMASVKIDGIRAYVALDSEDTPRVYSRTHKLIPNPHIQLTLGIPSLVGYEGELNLGPTKTFNEVQSWVMSKTLEPEFLEDHLPLSRFSIFGIVGKPLDALKKSTWNHTKMMEAFGPSGANILWGSLLQQHPTVSFEGLMFRRLKAPYKFGRCTTKEATFFKWKAKKSSEYVVVDYEEAVDKDGKLKGELGSLLVQERTPRDGTRPKAAFGVGTGFTAAQRFHYWENPETLIGKLVEVEYLNLSDNGIPRHPVFKGFKDEQG